MRKSLTGILILTLAVTLLACFSAVTGARVAYYTSKPAVSNAPKKDRPFVTSGYIKPKSTSSNRAKVKIILWMKYNDGWGVMDTYWTKVSARNSTSSKYSVTITIPMKGDHGVQAVQYRNGKKVSKSATRYFYVTP